MGGMRSVRGACHREQSQLSAMRQPAPIEKRPSNGGRSILSAAQGGGVA